MKKGQWLPLTKNRRLVLDVCSLSKHVPLFPAEMTVNVGAVSQARTQAAIRVSWAAIFTKAFAIAAVDQPQLRQAYFGWPWPHLYEHLFSNASIAMHRTDGDEDRLCWARLTRVEELSLSAIQERLDSLKTLPIEEAFAKQHRMSRLPFPVRRLMWMLALRMSGRTRAKSLGTFSVSSLAGMKTYNRFHPTILTTSLSYGPIDEAGDCLLTLICDHRVLDGFRAAKCLEAIDTAVNGEVLSELRALESMQNAA
ncbi:MAG: hypothetical protein R3C05_15870 [Pirellulaceae bacterium]